LYIKGNLWNVSLEYLKNTCAKHEKVILGLCYRNSKLCLWYP